MRERALLLILDFLKRVFLGVYNAHKICTYIYMSTNYCFCDGRRKYYLILRIKMKNFIPRAKIISLHTKKKYAIRDLDKFDSELNKFNSGINYYQIVSFEQPRAGSLNEIKYDGEIFNYAPDILKFKSAAFV